MTAFTLYGARGSTNTDRVRLTLAEGGFTNYELVPMNLQKGEHKVSATFTRPRKCLPFISLTLLHQSPEHMKRHPWGKIPVVAFPGGFTLFESRAICKHLTRKYSFPLLPRDSDIEAAALFDQAESAEILYFAGPAGTITFEKFVKKMMGLPADEAIVMDAQQSVMKFFDVAERLLQQKDYMAGNDFTLVDIYYIPLIRRLFVCGYGDIILGREAVSAWWDRCMSRPAIQQILAADEKAAAAARR